MDCDSGQTARVATLSFNEQQHTSQRENPSTVYVGILVKDEKKDYIIKYEACLDDGTLVAKTEEVEFTLKEGHPWVQVGGVTPDKPLDSAVLSRLKQFSTMKKLKKIAIRVSID
ncbi:hypothetical protein TSUD_397600 [Trifolium subterraneum]|uniref:Uncharacterized protein n=1 Tax=Trifolium subterraneum TaxID=3900 RepID=A0A2Z6NUF7_TRISU|nr:hypothetical protein TSUD_397600 [Trifolium subterraneum]